MEYFSKDDANHLLDSLKKHYAISTDWEGCNYLGLAIDWNYGNEYVNIYMSEYVKKALDRIQHPKPKRPNMPQIAGQSRPMEKDSKWHQIQTRVILLTKMPPKEYSPLWGPCYTMHGQ